MINMVRKQKWIDYGFETKTRSFRIPNFNNIDKERELTNGIDIFIKNQLLGKKNSIEYEQQNNLLKYLLTGLYDIMNTKMKADIPLNEREIEVLEKLEVIIPNE